MSRFSNRTLALFALATLCIVWSTTYTVIKVAIRDFPPYLIVGIRQTSAGLILLSIAALSGKLHIPNRKYIGLQALTGLLTITGGNGFVTWAMQYVSSGLSAVIGSMTPVMVLIINYFWHSRGERFHPLTAIGVITGFGGLGFIFYEGWADFLNPDYRWGIVGCFASTLTWSLGTVMAKRFNATGVSPIMNAGLQITAGGLGGFLMSVLFDHTHTIHHTTEGWLSVAYLALMGSALAFTLYMFMLQHLSATVASLYTYINPILALLLGAFFLGEKLTSAAMGGALITLFGLWLVNRGERLKK